jgi:hypothetical protein
MKKELVLQSVQNSVSSIFSKEDVINLINSVEAGGRKISVEDIERAIDQTISWIENNERDVLDLDSAEFEISYNNRLECVGVPINTDGIREALENNFMDFGEAEEEEEEVQVERTTLVEGAEFRTTGDL